MALVKAVPSVPNKLASVFIVGALALGLIWIYFPESFLALMDQQKISSDREGAGIKVIPVTLALLTVAGVTGILGSAIQGIASAWVRCPFQGRVRNSEFCDFFRKTKEKFELDYWEDQFQKLLVSESAPCKAKPGFSRYRTLYDAEATASGRQISARNNEYWTHPFSPLVAALFFRTETTQMSWVLQHYATYYLVTDFVVVASLSLILLVLSWLPAIKLWVTAAGIIYWNLYGYYGVTFAAVPVLEVSNTFVDFATFALLFLLHCAMLYGLLSVAAHRYYYTYNAALRYCCLYLIDQMKEDEASEDESGVPSEVPIRSSVLLTLFSGGPFFGGGNKA